uniref:Uncharacterized protein n=1 Tax=Glycine max TaxID=3847 RepID=C6T562_SOYBN|nr:unknown [Glycine max]
MEDFERGPRYHAYAALRETKLRMRQQEEEEGVVEAKVSTPPRKKQVKFQGAVVSGRKGSSSLVAQSVPDFSNVLRKENRKPVNGNMMLPPLMELTPPPSSSKSGCGVFSSARGSKSANAGEKRRGGVLMPRKSYASIDELKGGLSSATSNAINADNRGGKSSRLITRKTVLGYRHI